MSEAPVDVAGLLRKYGLRPDKSLGQNFLIDAAALQRVVQAAEIQPEDTILEIGPGLGSLTCLLAERARQVIAVELDGKLIPPLGEVLAPFNNIRLVQGDILVLEPKRLIGENPGGEPGSYLVVANIPYYITSALIRRLLEADLPPRRLVLTVQSEVAQRICADPGEMSLLALSVQVYGQPRIAAHIPAGAFYPPPKVDSAVVRVDLYARPQIEPALLAGMFRLAKAGFSQKRKTLRNAISGGMGWKPAQAEAVLRQAQIDPQRRAETLSVAEWGALAESASRPAG
jgi:16S rRNA (adenine1518-N6/adenine1519-N6)-dimethyltransferase